MSQEIELPIPPQENSSMLRVAYVIDPEYYPILKYLGNLSSDNKIGKRSARIINQNNISSLRWQIENTFSTLPPNHNSIINEFTDGSCQAVARTPNPDIFRVWIFDIEDTKTVKDVFANSKCLSDILDLRATTDPAVREARDTLNKVGVFFEMDSSGNVLISDPSITFTK
jgi:hypothetical protein